MIMKDYLNDLIERQQNIAHNLKNCAKMCENSAIKLGFDPKLLPINQSGSFDTITLNLKLKKKSRKPLAILVEKESIDTKVNQDISVKDDIHNIPFASTPPVSGYKLPLPDAGEISPIFKFKKEDYIISFDDI